MSASKDLDAPSRWGRARFGRRRVPALAVAVPAGLVLAVAVAALAAWIGFSPQRPVLGASMLAFAMVSPLTALVWGLCVDRSTLRGATDRPEESVESSWYDRAVRGAFHDVLIVTGLALAALTITDTRVEGTHVLIGVLVLCMVSTATRYAIRRQRG